MVNVVLGGNLAVGHGTHKEGVTALSAQ